MEVQQDSGFEASLGDDGVHRAISPVKGRFYEFSMAPDGALVVIEQDGRGLRLQLLDVSGGAGGEWGSELPALLQELHSHWFSKWVVEVKAARASWVVQLD